MMALVRLSDYLIPLLLAGAAIYALGRRVDVFSALTTGAGEGLRIVLRILPPLVALLTAVYMLRASGALEVLTRGLTPALTFLGIPPETVGLLLIRPVHKIIKPTFYFSIAPQRSQTTFPCHRYT